jgi:cobyrinic acid a,c-diamide synthase
MGLYDGRSPEGLDGSAAELSQMLNAPVVLVVDASGMGRSAAALVEGFANHVPEINVCGAILNRVGSSRHTEIIKTAMDNIKTKLPVHCIGGLPKNTDLFLPSRHLGLMAAHVSEQTRTEENRKVWRSQLASWAEENLDIDLLLDIASTSKTPAAKKVSSDYITSVRIGIALDDAFHFYYPDNLDLLTEMGAELIPFSPLEDTSLPPNLDGLIIGGGYPEEHARELSLNVSLKKSVFEFGQANKPIYAECGGLMYLGQTIQDKSGNKHNMVGLLPLKTEMSTKLRTLGYREVTTIKDSILGKSGTVFRGHEFHYSDLIDNGDCNQIFEWTGRKGDGTCGFTHLNILATYIHAHWGSNIELPRTFVRSCERFKEGHDASS